MIRIMGLVLVALLVLLGLQTCRLSQAGIENAKVRSELAAERAATALLAQEAEREARRVERIHAAAMADIERELREVQEHGLQEIDDLLGQLADGQRRLQQRFTCPPSRGVPGSEPSPGGSDAAEAAGFTQADAALAFRIAADGDAAIRQLAACQAVVRADRGDL